MCGLRQVQYRFFYLVLYYKKGYCNSIEEYCPSQYSKLVQYDILIGTIFLNISTKTQQYQRSVLLVEVTGVSGKNHCPAASHRQT